MLMSVVVVVVVESLVVDAKNRSPRGGSGKIGAPVFL